MYAEIDAFRRNGGPPASIVIRSSQSSPYAQVADSGRSPFVRHLLAAAGCDENRLFRWRLEHKLVQAQTLDHYAPGSAPRSCGLASFAWQHRREDLRRALRRAFPAGFLIKRALSDCSGESSTHNAAREAYAAVRPRNLSPCEERWLVQERIRIAREYRVHSFDREVIPDLTFHRYRADANVARGTNEFVQAILDRLPDGVVAGSFFAWDIARDVDRRRVVIEVNLTGVHPVFRPGFQTSGHLQHELTGAWATATLILHMEQRFGIRVDVDDDAPEPRPHWTVMYADVARELARLRA